MAGEIKDLMAAKRAAEQAVSTAEDTLAQADAALVARLVPGKAYSEVPNPPTFLIVTDGRLKEIRPVYIYADAAEKK